MSSTISEEYRRNLAAKALVLRELRAAGAMTGNALVGRLEDVCRAARLAEPEFDFAHWGGGSLWGHLDLFFRLHFIIVDGERPEGASEWRTAVLELAEGGARFLESAEECARDLLDALARAAPATAVG